MRTTVAFVAVFAATVLGTAAAEEPVYFPDTNLKSAVEAELWVWDPTPADMLALTTLEAIQQTITDLTGLEYATNLQTLSLAVNRITDVAPLAGLTNLRKLVLNNNQITHIGALAGLTNLYYLDIHDNFLSELSALTSMHGLEILILHNNQIDDISALAGLVNLRGIDLWDNQVSDISALTGLMSLNSLDLRNNPLNADAFDLYLPQILANNPGIGLQHDPRVPRSVSISSTEGGTVIDPGEGTFVYEDGEVIRLEAQAAPGYVFQSWSGSFSAADNPVTITLTHDCYVKANFTGSQSTLYRDLYVDSNAPCDPGPSDPAVSDPQEDGTSEHPFDSIQEAIDIAVDGASIFVQSGVYYENIDFLGKSIEVVGIDANDPRGNSYPVIDGAGTGPAVTFAGGETADSMLRGFVLTRGQDKAASAIACSQSSPTIANCLIVGNRTTGLDTAAVYCTDSSAVFVNCTITDNHSGETGAGLYLVNSDVVLMNSILWGNTPNDIVADSQSKPSITYSNVAGGWLGAGNIDVDPMFALRGYWGDADDLNRVAEPDDPGAIWMEGDYHLMSQTGRWDPSLLDWTQDDTSSPCIDGGEPAGTIQHEPAPHGDVVNMGAYGGTSQASKSSNRDIQWDQPIDFQDANLKAAVEAELWVWDPTPTDMLALTTLEAIQQTIADLTGLEYATNLQTLSLAVNRITDVTPLAGLTNLRRLVLNNNQVTSIGALTRLTHLYHLDVHDNFLTELSALTSMKELDVLILHNNRIDDVSALAGLANLRGIDLWDNRVSDISALAELTSLKSLDLRNNPLNADAFDLYLPQILANNPSINLQHDPRVPRSIFLSSTEGGSVIDPGEGTFVYEDGEVVRLEAQAAPGYVFQDWSGSFSAADNPVTITLTQDHYITANFRESSTGP